jgi:flavin reductase (DIM6/NTAB) family NADH-FMN oxidoreductase RutF
LPDFVPADLAPRDRSRLLTRIVTPRPIALVSTQDAEGRGNLAPFSFFNAGGHAPMSCVFSATRHRSGGGKDTLANIEATGEYVISLVTRSMAERVNQASFEYPRGTDEFDAVGFTRAPSTRVRPPRVAESPVALECRVFSIVPHGDGPGASNYVIGEILLVHADDVVCVEGLPDERLIEPAARLGADRWIAFEQDAVFALQRPG